MQTLFMTQNNLFNYGMSGCIRIPFDMVNAPRAKLAQTSFDSIHDIYVASIVSFYGQKKALLV